MYLKVALTPPVISSVAAAAQAARAAAAKKGMGFVPLLVKSPGGMVSLRIPIPNAIFRNPRGMGQVTPSTPNLPAGCTPIGTNLCQTALYGPVSCNEVRECDPVSGTVNFQYALPSGGIVPNADIVNVNPLTGQAISSNNAQGGIAPPSASPIPIGTQVEQGGITTFAYTPTPPAPAPIPAAPAASPAATVPPAAAPTPILTAAGGITQASQILPASSAVTASVLGTNPLGFLTGTVSLFGYSVPVWALGLGAVGAFVLLTSGGKGRH